ncbi:MAG: hypothetical protein Q4G22_06540 [Paracoccus sp. (in: a-proteobacteria)]|uniref:hypothetical protein n=1 Tax=Paracoccus sp. TaxID=267 RepID=UPI0026DEDA12|nr:hypothetical protein [Paracoccus sp. (in: a-proteobacteria)]MDO5631478.1 hypothetical protein [Paracoccus sp. (in: a-proteobacteria)]
MIHRLTAALVIGLAAAGAAPAQTPLSASDWLSGSVQAPTREASGWRPGDARPPMRNRDGTAAGTDALREPITPVARTGSVGRVTVSRLDSDDPDTAGTVTPAAAGLPGDLWNGSAADDLARLIDRTPARLPAMTALMQRLLTAQLAPPVSDSSRGRLFLARADRLLDMGDLDAARALLMQQAGSGKPEVFRRLFDIALLDGDEIRACQMMNSTPGIAPSFPARIFCLAQSGDWSAAAIVFHGASDLGLMDPARNGLMLQFLDDSYVDSGQALVPPDPLTPLDLRILEAVGQPLPTSHLPIAFAHSDLRPNSGWKARLDAAERLAAAGVLSPAEMLAIYSEQRPAASGGVWDRAAAVQALDRAIAAGNTAPDQELAEAAATFASAGAEDVLAQMLAPRLPSLTADTPQAQAALARLRAWMGQGDAPVTALPLPDPAQPPDARKGEALLAAMADIDAGIEGDDMRATRGLAAMAGLGLDSDARLVAAQIALERQQAARNR